LLLVLRDCEEKRIFANEGFCYSCCVGKKRKYVAVPSPQLANGGVTGGFGSEERVTEVREVVGGKK
jgi:hypothetical protein